MRLFKKIGIGSLLVAGVSLVTPFNTLADTIDFGGKPEKFSGRGDRIPPKCQVQSPNAAGTAFYILWSCEDEDAAQPDIRTELWVLRNGSSAWELVRPYLGFPAAFEVTATYLKTTTVAEGLPASFRVVGIDRAGNSTVSPSFTVNPGNSELLSCSLSVTTSGSETDESGETTGVPSQSVVVSAIPSEAIISSESAFTLTSSSETVATTCEIDEVCQDESKVSFGGSGTVDNSNSAEVQLSVAPGGVSGTLTGTIEKGENGAVTSLALTGAGNSDSQPVTLDLNCRTTEVIDPPIESSSEETSEETSSEASAATFESGSGTNVPNFEPL